MACGDSPDLRVPETVRICITACQQREELQFGPDFRLAKVRHPTAYT